jgi:hypothetical protein
VRRGAKKCTSKAKQAALTTTLAGGEPIDIPAGGSPPMVSESADDATAEIERLKAALAEKSENLAEAQKELRKARRAAARAPQDAVTSPASAPTEFGDIPAFVDQGPLSAQDKNDLADVIAAWNQSEELKTALTKASDVVRERFFGEVRQWLGGWHAKPGAGLH